jgi:predicted flap endonuclease-1-like 5' DNA nuclease
VAEATGEGAPAVAEVAAEAAAVAVPEGPEAKAAALVAAVTALEAKEQAASSELAESQAQLAEIQAQAESLQAQLQARDAELAELQGRVRASEPLQDAMSVAASLAGRPPFKTRASGAALIVGVQPYLSPKVQGLSQVIGIGSVRQQRLYNAGVGSFWELASLSNEELLQMLQLSDLRAQEVYYDGIRAEATRLARETNSVGCIWDGDHIDDFEPLTGVGKIYEQRLYEAGICTYEKLVETSVAELTEIIHAPQMQTPDFSQWIAEARKLMEERAQTKPS